MYLLDANVFIQAKNLHYGFDFCPAFWDWIDEQNNATKVFSVERVQDEILAVDDEPAAWESTRLVRAQPPISRPTYHFEPQRHLTHNSVGHI